MESTCAKLRLAQLVSEGGAAVVATAPPPLPPTTAVAGAQFNAEDFKGETPPFPDRPNQRWRRLLLLVLVGCADRC